MTHRNKLNADRYCIHYVTGKLVGSLKCQSKIETLFFYTFRWVSLRFTLHCVCKNRCWFRLLFSFFLFFLVFLSFSMRMNKINRDFMPCGPPIEKNGMRTITSTNVWLNWKIRYALKYPRTMNYRHHRQVLMKKPRWKNDYIPRKKCFDNIIDEFICTNCLIWLKKEKNHHGRFGAACLELRECTNE